MKTARRSTATRRPARLRWRRSLRAGGGNRAGTPLAWPPARSTGTLGGEIAGGNRERAGRLHRRTAAERFATILLPNSVAQTKTRQHRTKLGFAEMPINRAYLTQGRTG